MKIYDSNLSGAGASGAQRTQETQQTERSGTGRKTEAGGDAGDRVEFSGTMGRLSQVLSSFQTGRSARVQELAAQYQSGSYRADSKAISSAMISDALSGGAQAGLS